jgi:hypothetical protein
VEDTATGLQKLKLPHKYQAPREDIFPSAHSLAWYIRQNRARLVSAGALVHVAGRNLIHEEKFDAMVLELGREKLTKAVA